MSVDGWTYTVCGLRVTRERRPEDWTGFSAVSPPVDGSEYAVDFAQNDVKGDMTTGDRPIECIDLALACVHIGEVPIVGELTRATDPLTDGEVQAELARTCGLPYRTYTICGVDRYTFGTLCYVRDARSWLLAWLDAEAEARSEGKILLTAATHEGEYPPIEGFPYADRLAQDRAEMAMTVTDMWGARWLG